MSSQTELTEGCHQVSKKSLIKKADEVAASFNSLGKRTRTLLVECLSSFSSVLREEAELFSTLTIKKQRCEMFSDATAGGHTSQNFLQFYGQR